MTTTKKIIALAIPIPLALGLVGARLAVGDDHQGGTPYTSSIRLTDGEHDEYGEHGERAEAARLAALAKVDMSQATAAALAQVPGKALRTALENENGNVVYSVEVQTTGGNVKDVKVDGGTGTVLHVEAAGAEGEDHEDD